MRDERYFDLYADLEFKDIPLFRQSVSTKNRLPYGDHPVSRTRIQGSGNILRIAYLEF
jgi:hypothetical protein